MEIIIQNLIQVYFFNLAIFPLDITIVDINKSMLESGQERLKTNGLPKEGIDDW